MPDIDLDFRDDRRAEMMEYTARKYGDDKVAQIITFGTLGRAPLSAMSGGCWISRLAKSTG